ncbi:MAG TPA: sigma factor-like helix-turn-helix DNA-binding protein [Candidatus Eisenbacteria bacterium]|nr:sigma factor-like helix-turn-helix DNA-binding protein [Candidatus Eisenbacteria bacterium]
MSTASVTSGRLPFAVITGCRARRQEEEMDCRRADAMFFRAQTLAIVRHFFEIACQVGRLPSILGREFFRARVSHHAVPSFEEQAVFVHDVERALARLNEQDAEVVGLVGLFQYSLDEVSELLGLSRSCIHQRFTDGVDRLAELFLEAGLLREDRPDRRLRRFDAPNAAADAGALPPKKPAASVDAEAYHEVAADSAKYTFPARTWEA